MKRVVKTKSTILNKAKPIQEQNLGMAALFYGRSGTGKTTLSGSFPKKMLVIDVGEKGTDSLANLSGVDVIQIDTWTEFEELYWELSDTDHGYSTISIDAIHSLQVLAIREAKILANKKADDQTSQKDFGQASGLLNIWLMHYRDLITSGLHVIFLAHDRVTEVDTDDDSEVIMPEVGPRMMPSVASTILGAVNVVGNTFIRETITKSRKAGEKPIRKVDYCLRVGPHGYYATKIRRPKTFPLPEYIVDPSYDKLSDVIQGKGNKPTGTPKRNIRRNSEK